MIRFWSNSANSTTVYSITIRRVWQRIEFAKTTMIFHQQWRFRTRTSALDQTMVSARVFLHNIFTLHFNVGPVKFSQVLSWQGPVSRECLISTCKTDTRIRATCVSVWFQRFSTLFTLSYGKRLFVWFTSDRLNISNGALIIYFRLNLQTCIIIIDKRRYAYVAIIIKFVCIDLIRFKIWHAMNERGCLITYYLVEYL